MGQRGLDRPLRAAEGRLASAERRSAELALVAEFAAVLAHSLDPDLVAANIARMAVEFTGAAECTVWRLSSAGELIQIGNATGMPAVMLPLDARRHLLRQALDQRQTLVIAEAGGAPDGSNVSYVALPLICESALLGALELVAFPHPEHLGEEVLCCSLRFRSPPCLCRML